LLLLEGVADLNSTVPANWNDVQPPTRDLTNKGVAVDDVLFGPKDEQFASLLAHQMWTKYFENLNTGECH
jgi:hypothetical protein